MKPLSNPRVRALLDASQSPMALVLIREFPDRVTVMANHHPEADSSWEYHHACLESNDPEARRQAVQAATREAQERNLAEVDTATLVRVVGLEGIREQLHCHHTPDRFKTMTTSATLTEVKTSLEGDAFSRRKAFGHLRGCFDRLEAQPVASEWLALLEALGHAAMLDFNQEQAGCRDWLQASGDAKLAGLARVVEFVELPPEQRSQVRLLEGLFVLSMEWRHDLLVMAWPLLDLPMALAENAQRSEPYRISEAPLLEMLANAYSELRDHRNARGIYESLLARAAGKDKSGVRETLSSLTHGHKWAGTYAQGREQLIEGERLLRDFGDFDTRDEVLLHKLRADLDLYEHLRLKTPGCLEACLEQHRAALALAEAQGDERLQSGIRYEIEEIEKKHAPR